MDGKQRFSFPTLKEALDKANSIKGWIDDHGIKNAPLIDAELTEYSKRLGSNGATIAQACEFYLKHLATLQASGQSKLISELCPMWYADRKNDKETTLRDWTLKNIYVHSVNISKALGSVKVKMLTTEDCQVYKTSRNTKGQDASQILMERRQSYLIQFLNWCITKGYLITNPALSLKAVKLPDNAKEFLSVKKCHILLSTVIEKHMELLGYVSLCLFVGIRPYECEHLTWDDIDMNTKQVTVEGDTAKTGELRRPELSDNCFAWLSYLKTLNCPLIPAKSFQNKWSKLKKSLPYEWSHDVMRHTYATMTYAIGKDLAALSETMGNDPKVCRKHYRGLVQQTEAIKFWDIFPFSLVRK